MPDGRDAPDYYVRRQTESPRRGRLFVVSGPSGVGKDTVIQHMLPTIDHVVLSVSATTRAPRPGETDGDPYHFFKLSDFRALVELDSLLEYAEVNGNYYGTPRSLVDDELMRGHDVLLKIDVQGATTVRDRVPDAVLVFLMPPSFAELERRLRARNTETEDQIDRRLLDARKELQEIPRYDYAVLNDDVEHASNLLRAIFLAERCHVRHDGPDQHRPSIRPPYLHD
jgi:guanylate kinase